MSIAKYINLEYQSFLTIVAAISIYYISRIIFEYSERPNLSVLIYFAGFFFYWPYSGIRGALVLSIGMYYFCRYIEDKKLIKIIFIIYLLSLLHVSALGYILLIPFVIHRISNRNYILFILSILLLSIFLSHYTFEIIKYLSVYERIKYYADEEQDVLNFKLFARVCIFLSALLSYTIYQDKLNYFNIKLYQVFLASLPIYIVFSGVGIVAEQISLFAYVYIIIVPVNTLIAIQRKTVRKVLIAAIIIFSINYFYITYSYTVDASQRNFTNIYNNI
jgi:hypothetical protein